MHDMFLHASALRASTNSSLCSSITDNINNSGAETSSISSRISLRHGISLDQLKLLSVNPPETKISDIQPCRNRNSNDSISYTGTGDPSDPIRVKDTYADNSVTGVDSTTKFMIDEETVVKHPDLWFEDGSVICRAESTLFCVHMSQLARHSLVFNDMFMLPQALGDDGSTKTGLFMALSRFGGRLGLEESALSSSTEDTFMTRRVPVVYLYDAAEDVANLFKALYDGPSFGNNDEDDFRLVSGILRLSTKYLIDSLRARALAHLTIAWPSTLKAWDVREDLTTRGDGQMIRYPHPACVINLAREVDASCLLPAAFYDISRNLFSQIFETTEDDPLYRTGRVPPSLSPQDMQRLCLGKEASQLAITTLIQNLGHGRYFRHAAASQKNLSWTHLHGKRQSMMGLVCVSAAVCRKDFAELKELATQHYLFDRENGCCDPLYVAEELGQLKSTEFSECKSCANALESWACREREKIWKMIPHWFRLEVLSSPQ